MITYIIAEIILAGLWMNYNLSRLDDKTRKDVIETTGFKALCAATLAFILGANAAYLTGSVAYLLGAGLIFATACVFGRRQLVAIRAKNQ